MTIRTADIPVLYSAEVAHLYPCTDPIHLYQGREAG
jgi:hypothetical protein